MAAEIVGEAFPGYSERFFEDEEVAPKRPPLALIKGQGATAIEATAREPAASCIPEAKCYRTECPMHGKSTHNDYDPRQRLGNFMTRSMWS